MSHHGVAPKNDKLMQTTVPATVARVFDRIAAAKGHKRASYLRLLVRNHVRDHQLQDPGGPLPEDQRRQP